MRHLLILSACLGAVPAVAHAACPTGDSFRDTPIVFTVDGEDEIHRRAPNGVVTIDSAPDENGVAVRSIVAHGVHVLQLADVVDGVVDQQSVWRFAFPVAIADLPAPAPGKGWEVTTTALIDGSSTTEQISHTWGKADVFTVGSCSYTAIPVTASYTGEDYDHTEDMIYFPDLGTAILLSYRDADGADTYTYTDIRSQ